MLKQEKNKSFWTVDNTVAQQRLEGLEQSHDVISDLERAAHWEMTVNEVISNINKRFMDEHKDFLGVVEA